MGDSMLSEHDAVDVAIDSERFLELLKNAEQLSLVSFLAQIPLPIAILDKESRFLGLNQLFADIYDSDALYLNGKLLKNISIIVYNQFMELLPGFQAGSKYANFEFYAKGHFYLSYYKALREKNGELIAIVVMCADVTRLKRRENVLMQNNKKLHDHLYLDPVTNLPNRMAFDIFLKEREEKHGSQISQAFLKIDMDGFKTFNRENSYTFGDEVLGQIANTLTLEMPSDIAHIFRLNSADFILSVQGSTEWAILTLAERLKLAIEQLQIRFSRSSLEVLTASVGVVFWPAGCDISIENLMGDLDQAVYQAKKLGKNKIYMANIREE